MRKNKYEYNWIVQGKYEGKWEDIYIGINRNDSLCALQDYNVDEKYVSHRLICRRELAE